VSRCASSASSPEPDRRPQLSTCVAATETGLQSHSGGSVGWYPSAGSPGNSSLVSGVASLATAGVLQHHLWVSFDPSLRPWKTDGTAREIEPTSCSGCSAETLNVFFFFLEKKKTEEEETCQNAFYQATLSSSVDSISPVLTMRVKER
jgi:hypothetical protein